MESSQLVSWQFENFSTAELSPPTSPASPSSPLFYHDGSDPSSPCGSFKGLNNGTTMVSKQSQKPVLSSVLSSRAQTASNVLNELERLHSYEQQSAFGMDTNEESVELNMNLFEELADLEYSPPLISSQADDIKMLEVPTAPSVVVAPHNDKLSAEFKSIVESLSTNGSSTIIPTTTTSNSNVVTSLEDLIQITGIPTTTVVGDECLVPVEFIGRPISNGGDLGPDEAESMDLDGIIISNDMALVNENELFSLEELSAELIAEENSKHGTTTDNTMLTLVDGVLPYWAKGMTVPLDELDTAMNKNDETLTALLQGDVSSAAKNFNQPEYAQPAFSPISNASEDNAVLEEAEVIEVVEKPAPKKTERRGRKPAKKDSLTYVKDKALRKKEQNKTAATRYRQKKKEELAVTLAEEEVLQSVHDELEKEKEKVGSELRMVRSLLRDMLQARKKRSSSSSSVPSRLTASSIVQAQRIANRRK